MDRANPTLEQMAQHWFYSFGTNPVLIHLLIHVLVFDIQVGGLGSVWLIDSGCSRQMSRDMGWFSSLTQVVYRTYITFGDNGRGCVLAEGEVRVTDKVVLKRVALVKSLGLSLLSVPSFLRKASRCCLSRVVLGYLMLEVTLSVWSFLRVKYSERISRRVQVCIGVLWLVLQVSCGSGIGGWVT
jgi:hypothetical protein